MSSACRCVSTDLGVRVGGGEGPSKGGVGPCPGRDRPCWGEVSRVEGGDGLCLRNGSHQAGQRARKLRTANETKALL